MSAAAVFFLIFVASVLFGQESARSLRGTLVYAQKMALPRGAGISVLLVDLTAPGSPIARQEWQNEGRQVPIPFALAVPSRSPYADHRYEIRAEIRIREKPWFSGARSLTAAELRRPGMPLVVLLNRVP